MIEIAAAAFYAYGFRHGNLYVIDIATVPDGLEDPIGKAKRHDVLNRFFAQIMIDAVNLFFVGDFEQLLIKDLGRLKVVTEGLFDDDPPPVIVILLHQSAGGELFDNLAEITWSRCHVVEDVLVGRMIAVNLCEAILELGKDLVVVEISHEVIEAACKTFPNFVFDTVATIFSDVL